MRADVDNFDILDTLFARQDASLDSSSVRDSFIRVDSSRRFLTTEELFE